MQTQLLSTWARLEGLETPTFSSVDCAARIRDLGTQWLACQDGTQWRASSFVVTHCRMPKIRPRERSRLVDPG
jgi:hypothetical protein